jgi:hypothetical protein
VKLEKDFIELEYVVSALHHEFGISFERAGFVD